jgi:hypothetical protein
VEKGVRRRFEIKLAKERILQVAVEYVHVRRIVKTL